jgi:hypothetical protein
MATPEERRAARHSRAAAKRAERKQRMARTPEERAAADDSLLQHMDPPLFLDEPTATADTPPDLLVDWTKDKGRGVDLGDAVEAGMRDPEADVTRAMGDMTTAAQDYHRKLVDLLTSLSRILEDGIADFERLTARFTRNP